MSEQSAECVALPEVQVLRLQPGDVIVARVEAPLPYEVMKDLRDQLEESFPGHKAIITVGLTIEVARHSDGDGCGS